MSEQMFVAREHELAQLDGFLDKSFAGHGQVCFVTGEAGTGKTALVTEFARCAQAQHDDLLVAIGECNAQTGIGDPYLPFREILGMLTGDVERELAQGTITQDNASRLQNFLRISGKVLVELGPDLIEIFVPAAALATRAGAFLAGRAGWLDRLEGLTERKAAVPGDTSLQQSYIFEQYTNVLNALAAKHPLMLVMDDLQWADAGSISLLFHLGRRIGESRILIVGAYRPADVALGRGGERHPLESVVNEFKRYFGNIWVDLDQVDETEDRQFVDAFLDTEPNRLDEGFRQALYRHTKGHPLFTIELLRNLRERGDLVQDEERRWVEGPTLEWDALPARVEGVIEERISRLEEELREALTVASVEGEDFTAEVVARVQALDERGLVRRLSGEVEKKHHLVGTQGLRRLGPQRLSLYRFLHTLFQKYLYNSLDEAERAYLHEDVGNVLEELYGDQTEDIAVQLARHFLEAGIDEKAIEYLLQAGSKALRLYAYEEAIAHLTKGLELLKTLPDTPGRAQQELLLQTMLGAALVQTKGFAVPEVGTAFDRARELCQQVGETPLLFPVLRGLAKYYVVRAKLQTSRELGERFLTLAQSVQDSDLRSEALLEAHYTLGEPLLFLGEFASTRAHMEQGAAVYDPQQHRSLAFLYGQDPGVSCLTWAAWALWLLGYPDQALQRSQEALALAEELSHPFSLAFALAVDGGIFHQLRREEQAAQDRAEEAVTLATEHGFPLPLAWGTIVQGWVLAKQGQGEEGIVQMQQGIAGWQATGARLMRPHQLALLAEAYGNVGQIEKGLTVLAEAMAETRDSGDCCYEAELRRLKGELLLKQGEAEAEPFDSAQDEAEACFRQAIEVARQQQAKSWELRAVMSLSRLMQQQGRGAKGRQMLAELYGWFTEGFDTADLKEARWLLEELSSSNPRLLDSQ